MSYIKSTYRCKKCSHEFNVAVGTFGYGFPEECPKCGDEGGDWSEYLGDGWFAKKE